jgi:hypothetical protein
MLRRLLVAFLLVLATAAPALAREEIRDFEAAVTLLSNGSVDVTETITVNAEGLQIRRGIFRDIPTTLVNDDNSRLRSSLHVVSVTRDGRAEPYSTEAITNGKRIRIGDADVFLSTGVHRYVIRYTMTRMARFFPDHDELFWNATGNYWDFPILHARATVRLPEAAAISQLVVYTGRFGSQAHDATARQVTGTLATFETTRTLQPGEGMSVAVAFQKGVLAAPSGLQALFYWFSDHRDLVLPAFAVLIVLLYNYFAWDSVGRDPARGTIIPLFHPPRGFSPALVHFIHRMGWRNNGWTAFTASMFDLGVKGLIRIDQPDKKVTVTVTGKKPGEPLPPGESVLWSFFNGQGKITFDRDNGDWVYTRRGEMVSAIEKENRQVWFNNNTGHVVVGALLSLAMLGALVLFGVLQPAWLVAAGVAGVVLLLFTSAFRQFWSGNGLSRFIIAVWVLVFGFNMLGGVASMFDLFNLDMAAVAAVSIVVIDVVFAILLRAPTVQGRRVMDEIEGFRMYLDTAEKERLNLAGEPPMTITRFEAILPFAIALGVEKPWSEHFEGELARNAVADASNGVYSPGWYSGHDFSTSGSGGFSNAVSAATSGMSAAMIAAQPASSSSSGFGGGGGGGSGGGGGGGGGGGW